MSEKGNRSRQSIPSDEPFLANRRRWTATPEVTCIANIIPGENPEVVPRRAIKDSK